MDRSRQRRGSPRHSTEAAHSSSQIEPRCEEEAEKKTQSKSNQLWKTAGQAKEGQLAWLLVGRLAERIGWLAGWASDNRGSVYLFLPSWHRPEPTIFSQSCQSGRPIPSSPAIPPPLVPLSPFHLNLHNLVSTYTSQSFCFPFKTKSILAFCEEHSKQLNSYKLSGPQLEPLEPTTSSRIHTGSRSPPRQA